MNKKAVLSIVFKDKKVVTLDGQRLIFDTTRRGGIAPTERNLLSPLEGFIRDSKEGRATTTLGIWWYEYENKIDPKKIFGRLHWKNTLVAEIVQDFEVRALLTFSSLTGVCCRCAFLCSCGATCSAMFTGCFISPRDCGCTACSSCWCSA